jgi:hypothetical protein
MYDKNRLAWSRRQRGTLFQVKYRSSSQSGDATGPLPVRHFGHYQKVCTRPETPGLPDPCHRGRSISTISCPDSKREHERRTPRSKAAVRLPISAIASPTTPTTANSASKRDRCRARDCQLRLPRSRGEVRGCHLPPRGARRFLTAGIADGC